MPRRKLLPPKEPKPPKPPVVTVAKPHKEVRNEEMNVVFGIRCWQARKLRGWQVQELAERAQVRVPVLYNLERGAEAPSIAEAWRISQALGVDIACMVGDADISAVMFRF